jgi:hypothetical protein
MLCLGEGVNEEWLRTGNGEMFGPPTLADQEKELLALFRGMIEISRRTILDHARCCYRNDNGHDLAGAHVPKEGEPDPLTLLAEAFSKRNEDAQG